MRDRWAQELLAWEWRGLQLVAEISRCRYFVRGERHEILAWCELRDVSGGRRCEIGSFRDVAAAKAACERDAQLRLSKTAEDRGPVSVAIASRRGRGLEAGSKPARAPGGRVAQPPGPADAGAALDDALAAFADVVGEE
jgi:hypothetical protein